MLNIVINKCMFIYHQEGWWDKYKYQSIPIKSHLSGNSSSSDTNNKSR